MSVQTQRSIAIQNQADAFVRCIARESIAASACPTHTDGNTKKDVNYVNVITPVRLVNRVTCTLASVCAAKVSLDVSVINAPLATLVIQAVTAAVVIAMVPLLQTTPNRFRVMKKGNVYAKHW